VSFDLDEQAWGETNAVLNEALGRLSEIGNESARKSKQKVRATFGLMGFESPPKALEG
jgi:hypothetical protein